MLCTLTPRPPRCRSRRREPSPACAGSILTAVALSPCSTDHPRSRGEYDFVVRLVTGPRPSASRGGQHHTKPGGLRLTPLPPPCARGTREPGEQLAPHQRTTPACAGNTGPRTSGPACSPDHPRLRGEHPHHPGRDPADHGPPPPARGTLLLPPGAGGEGRTTPACAGNTYLNGTQEGTTADHPRLRGEHAAVTMYSRHVRGPPPPARGTQFQVAAQGRGHRTTPACAGNTRRCRTAGPARADHPRLRGEHAPHSGAVDAPHGPPPPARGTRGRK